VLILEQFTGFDWDEGNRDQRESVLSSMKRKELPIFTSQEEERDFWATHDATDYVDWSDAEQVLMPNLKPTLKTVSVRLPEFLLDSIKVLANKRDVPYQSLIKILLVEGVERELSSEKESETAAILRESGTEYHEDENEESA